MDGVPVAEGQSETVRAAFGAIPVAAQQGQFARPEQSDQALLPWVFPHGPHASGFCWVAPTRNRLQHHTSHV